MTAPGVPIHKQGCVLPPDHSGWCSLTPAPGVPRTAAGRALRNRLTYERDPARYEPAFGAETDWDADILAIETEAATGEQSAPPGTDSPAVPRTAAGRALYDLMLHSNIRLADGRRAILAIEAEAVSKGLRGVDSPLIDVVREWNATRELRIEFGPVVISQTRTDPGDMGEPRVFESDGVTYVAVPDFDQWAAASGQSAPAGTDSGLDVEESTHCGFVFEVGTKCYADEGHPIHHEAWNWLSAAQYGKFDRHGPEPDHDFQPEPHHIGVLVCQDCGARLAARKEQA